MLPPIPFLLSALASAVPAVPTADDVAIAYGTSFGECVGYCIQEIRISGGDVDFLAGRTHAAAASEHRLSDFHSKMSLDKDEADDIWRLVSSVRYNGFPERLGCPDCNDGGAEWFEFATATHKKNRITFERGHAPMALWALAERCSQIQPRFKPLLNQPRKWSISRQL